MHGFCRKLHISCAKCDPGPSLGKYSGHSPSVYNILLPKWGEKHDNCVVISEKLTHDASSFHLFKSRVIEYLKKKFGDQNIKRIFYFSDGAGSQYKNKSNSINLFKHREDFGIIAQWNLFTTSHGKGPCDGIERAVKRQAYWASLKKVDENHITNPRSLFKWARNHFSKINFNFCSQNEHEMHRKSLKARFEQATTIKTTRQYHCYEPIDDKMITCKLFSKDSVFVKNVLMGKKSKK